jgi:hypothetical protein
MKRRLLACLCGLGIVAAAALAAPLSASAEGYVPSGGCTTSTPSPGNTGGSTSGSTDESCQTPASLQGSVVTGKCIANAPWIFFDIIVNNPNHLTLSGHDVTITMTDSSGNTWTQSLGTISHATEGPSATKDFLTLTGKTLWPGASVGPDGVTPTGWPGWTQNSAGEWVETSGNYAWTRTVHHATIAVNPEMSVAVSYPPATPSCNAGPPTGVHPAVDGNPTGASGWLADTGSNLTVGLWAGSGIIVLGGLVFTIALLRRRRVAHEE